MTKLTTVGMKRQLLVGAVLVFITGVVLFFGAEHTDTYFAWTINPPLLTAAFLGATYLSSFVLGFLAAREDVWARARVAVPGPLIFTILTLVVTLIHFDRFHLSSPKPTAVFFTWAWLAVYVGVPISMTIMLIRQLRAPGDDLVRQMLLPVWMRVAFIVLAIITFLVGVALFIAPQNVSFLWAWQLKPLTARAIAAWLIAIGTVAAQVVWENDYTRLKPVAIFFTTFGILQFLTLARYPIDFAWGEPRGWVYLVTITTMLLLGVLGWIGVRRHKLIPLIGRVDHPNSK